MGDITKEALQYVVSLQTPDIITINDKPYCDRVLNPVLPPKVGHIAVRTLDGFLDFVRGIDTDSAVYHVHVVSAREVRLIVAHSGQFEQVKEYAAAYADTADLKSITGEYQDVEDFIIRLNTLFDVDKGDHAKVREIMAGLESTSELTLTDDGLTQAATFRQGIRRVAKGEIPNPVILHPYATFPEIGQPGRKFLLRLQRCGNDIEARLFQVAEPTWESRCMDEIKKYLAEKLTEVPISII